MSPPTSKLQKPKEIKRYLKFIKFFKTKNLITKYSNKKRRYKNDFFTTILGSGESGNLKFKKLFKIPLIITYVKKIKIKTSILVKFILKISSLNNNKL